jgi:hypothetical protein
VGIIALGVYSSSIKLSEQFSYELPTRGKEIVWMDPPGNKVKNISP